MTVQMMLYVNTWLLAHITVLVTKDSVGMAGNACQSILVPGRSLSLKMAAALRMLLAIIPDLQNAHAHATQDMMAMVYGALRSITATSIAVSVLQKPSVK